MFKELRDCNEMLLDALQLMKVASEDHFTPKARIIVDSFLNKQDFSEELMKYNEQESPDKKAKGYEQREGSVSSNEPSDIGLNDSPSRKHRGIVLMEDD